MRRLAESLEKFPRNRGIISLPHAIELFPMATDDLIDRDVSTIQIAQSSGFRLPNADDVMKYVGGVAYTQIEMSDQTSNFDPTYTNETHEKYSWAIKKACSDEPMCDQEIIRYATLLDLKEEAYIKNKIEFLIESEELQHTENIIFLKKSSTDPAANQSVYVETFSKGYKTKKKGRKVKPDRRIPTLPINLSTRELVTV